MAFENTLQVLLFSRMAEQKIGMIQIGMDIVVIYLLKPNCS